MQDVAFLAFFTSLSTLASMAQQLHTYLRWTSIKLEQFDYVKANVGNPELSVAGASVGVDLVLFYIQWYCYNVESILIVSWAAGLAYSVYRPNASGSITYYASSAAKPIAIVLPIIQLSLMRSTVVQNSLVGFYFLANVIMAFGLVLGVILLLTILVRYISTRPVRSWHVEYGGRSTVDNTADPVTPRRNNTLGRFSGIIKPPTNHKSIYDNWLVIRFALAFAGLSVFQLVIIAQEVTLSRNNKKIALESVPDLSSKVAVGDVVSFLPGVSASLLAFIVFGTTKAFQDYFYRSLAPRSVGRRCRQTMKTLSIVSTHQPRRHSEPIPGSFGGYRFELGGEQCGAGMGREDDLEIREREKRAGDPNLQRGYVKCVLPDRRDWLACTCADCDPEHTRSQILYKYGTEREALTIKARKALAEGRILDVKELDRHLRRIQSLQMEEIGRARIAGLDPAVPVRFPGTYEAWLEGNLGRPVDWDVLLNQ
ncbi:hypothetical protein VMCG_02265 [Cytospora schulzeri]|uniref:Uncharacterized protein n=1 Tax=Cytospora schulzeri TaxID=448051 RepID=A0A423X0P4_9PEZI|nr:hypothetical protein VMCG_02265 [Valsa malicola]